MNRFLSVASSALIATGLAVLPVASFAQSGADVAKTAVPPQVTPAQATPAVKTSATAETPVVSEDKTQPVKTAPTATAKTDVTAPTKGKTETHSMNTRAKHHAAKVPAKDTLIKG